MNWGMPPPATLLARPRGTKWLVLRGCRSRCSEAGPALDRPRSGLRRGAHGLFYFSRAFETEADLLGIEYLWKAGYDPNASIDMFERVESTERKQPGSVSKLFRTHPPTPDRIAKTQRNVDTLLPARSEYVLNTSEYEDIRIRLADLLPQHRPSFQDSDKPTLRRSSER